jgi:hypothetical protein
LRSLDIGIKSPRKFPASLNKKSGEELKNLGWFFIKEWIKNLFEVF